MTAPIQSLSNMEYQLYGGVGLNTAAPCYLNGYQGTSNLLNSYYPSYYGNYSNYGNYGYNNLTFGQTIPSNYSSSNGQAGANPNFEKVSQEDLNNLADYYAKSNVLEEGFTGAAAGGLSWLAFEHAQTVLHPINAVKGFKEASAIFKDIPKEFYKQNSHLIQEAYIAAQQATRDTGSKWFYSKWLRKPINEADIKPLLEELKQAVASQNPEAIAKASARLQGARGFDGRLIFNKKLSVNERLTKNAGKIAKEATHILEFNKGNFMTAAKGMFKKDFIGFMIFESIFSAGKIVTAFGKDTDTGIKQTGQSLVKAASGTAGWCLGRAGGTLLGAKVGAMIGSAFPGVGTAVGALVGFTIGSIGMWAGHKLGTAIVGQDIADKIEAQNLTKTPEGQAQLLQYTAEKIQKGEKVDPKAQLALQKFINQYS